MDRLDAEAADAVTEGLDMDDVDMWSGMAMTIEDYLKMRADLAGMTVEEYLDAS
jgi:hypothetical protein